MLRKFDRWQEKANRDPEAYELHRRRLIEKYLRRLSRGDEHRHRRLQGLQFQIDAQRSRSKPPLAVCIDLSAKMWNSVTKLGHAFQQPLRLLEERDRQVACGDSCEILSITEKSKKRQGNT